MCKIITEITGFGKRQRANMAASWDYYWMGGEQWYIDYLDYEVMHEGTNHDKRIGVSNSLFPA